MKQLKKEFSPSIKAVQEGARRAEVDLSNYGKTLSQLGASKGGKARMQSLRKK